MLGQSFQTESDRLQAQATAVGKAGSDRDTFILAQFPALDAAFAQMVDAVTGAGPSMTVTHTAATDHFTNHTFASLNKTVTKIASTLYGAAESVTFTPALESIEAGQFGVIAAELDNLNPPDPAHPILVRGILMRGATSARLAMPIEGGGYMDLTNDILEAFLTQLFIRT